MKLAATALALGLGLAGCAGTIDTKAWPNPDDVAMALSGIQLAYNTDCAFQPTAKWCTPNVKAKVEACVPAAAAGLKAYHDAYVSGKITDAVLANEQALLPALITCVAKAKSGA